MAYYVVEMIAQSRETDRDDLANHDVITFPVIGGPFDDKHDAERLADDATEAYAVITAPESL